MIRVRLCSPPCHCIHLFLLRHVLLGNLVEITRLEAVVAIELGRFLFVITHELFAVTTSLPAVALCTSLTYQASKGFSHSIRLLGLHTLLSLPLPLLVPDVRGRQIVARACVHWEDAEEYSIGCLHELEGLCNSSFRQLRKHFL